MLPSCWTVFKHALLLQVELKGVAEPTPALNNNSQPTRQQDPELAADRSPANGTVLPPPASYLTSQQQ
ncbi:hypothetical protein HaLaN_06560, partial [Haematococcus lacustris]